MKIIALDVGEKRIGVAKADSSTRIAVPVTTISVDGSEWQEIGKLARLQGTEFFVLGLPRSNEGKETAQSLYVRNFAKKLIEKIPGAKIRFQDESLTSVVAEERLKKRKKSYAKGEIDMEAATIILQDFLESFSERSALKSPEKSTSKPQSKPKSPTLKAETAATTVKNLSKKELNKVKLNTKKAKHKIKTSTKWISGVGVLLVLGLVATGAAFIIRDKIRAEREAEYAKLEAEMVAEVFNFTIRPGETIFDIKKHLIEVGYSAEEVEKAFNASYDFDFLKDRPAGASLEGYLYGETHEFYKNESVEKILETFLAGMGEVIRENDLRSAYGAQGLTLHEGITLASIIQKEAPPLEQANVAQVFLTRLDYGMPLGSDVTVSYALDIVDPDRHTYTDNQAALAVDSCYNTRIHTGLPCGPISNPALSALLAVAHPSNNSYLYFLTGDDGVMYYGYTEAEHIQNIYKHCQKLCNIAL